MSRQKLIAAGAGVILALGVLAFSVVKSNTPPPLPVVQAGENARTEDAPEVGITMPEGH